MTDLDRIKELAEAATPGPWKARGLTTTTVVLDGSNKVLASLGDPLSGYHWKAAAYIAAVSPDVVLRLVNALEAVQALHVPEKRWMPYEGAGVSFDSELEALQALDDVDVNQVVLAEIAENGFPYFEVCSHCKRLEESPCEGQCVEEAGYLESLWPCLTVKAITKALGEEA